jgi:hypothetical protein
MVATFAADLAVLAIKPGDRSVRMTIAEFAARSCLRLA